MLSKPKAVFGQIVFAAAALVWVAGPLYFLITARSAQGPHWGTALSVAVPAFVVAVVALGVRLKPDARFNAALLMCSTIVSMYGAEMYLSILAKGQPHSFWGDDLIRHRAELVDSTKRDGTPIDFRSKRAVVMDLRRVGVDAVPTTAVSMERAGNSLTSVVRINGEEVLPFGGISNRRTVFCNEGGQYTIFDSDEHGFNNPPGLWKRGNVDVITLGDSFALGGCVPSDKNFVSLIRRQYPTTINAGYPGAGPLSMLGMLKEALTVVKPRAVLWFFHENDFTDVPVERQSPLLLRYLEEGFTQKLLFRQPEIDGALTQYIDEEMKKTAVADSSDGIKAAVDKLQLAAKLTTLRTDLGLLRTSAEESDSVSEQTKLLLAKILSDANDATKRAGGQLFFVFLPAWERYASGSANIADRDAVLEVVRSIGIPLIDVHRTFESTKDPLSLFPFRRFGHYNEAGHSLVAATVLPVLTSRLVPTAND